LQSQTALEKSTFNTNLGTSILVEDEVTRTFLGAGGTEREEEADGMSERKSLEVERKSLEVERKES